VRYTLPAPPEPVPPAPFPLLGVLAPLLAAGAIWAVTRSPFALVFAVLSPVIAVASVIDARVQGRRRARAAAADERRALAELAAAIGERLRTDRAGWSASTPSAGAIVGGTAPGAAMWRTGGCVGSLVLGLGERPSGIVLDGRPCSPEARELVGRASVLDGVPLTAAVRGGIGVCGPPLLARAVLRGLVLQFLFAAPPGAAVVRARPDGGDWSWLDGAPHGPAATGAGAERVLISDEGGEVLLAAASVASELPSGCGTVLAVSGVARARIVATAPGADGDAVIVPELVTAAQAAAVIRALAAHPRAAVHRADGAALPASVRLDELLLPLPPVGASGPGSPDESVAERRAARLVAALGVREGGGALLLDLVADGPHAVVAGTTGSGKSELLVSWVCSLAATYEPAEVSFLLVDFKGGSAFDPLARLPHCVGLLTDLGPGQAQRALVSLRAEIRQRERLLRRHGARDVASCPAGVAPPRLVIVVDEFAAMLTEFPDLHEVFVDLAARGRSLGVHLVLCTQRPSGSVRDSLLANCNLRLSLRVNSRADSATVIGSDAASALPAQPVGRCIVRAGGADPVLAQVASAGPALADIVERIVATGSERGWAGQRRPWLEPLPAVLGPAELEDPAVRRSDVAGAIVFGLLDVPEEQAREYAAWHPVDHGPLLVLGGPRAGKTGLLAALGRSAPARRPLRVLPADPGEAWDVIGAALEEVRARAAAGGASRAAPGGDGGILAIDDVDVLLGRLDAEYAAELVDRLAALLREGGATGCTLVLTAQRLSGAIAPLAANAGRVLLLRLASRQEHVLAGGEASAYDPGLPPGGGWWQGHRAQVASVPPLAPAAPRPPRMLKLRPGRAYAVVSTRPAETARRLRSASTDVALEVTRLGSERGPAQREGPVRSDGRVAAPAGAPGGTGPGAVPVLLGDPDEWQAQWGTLQEARWSRCIVYDGCTPRDVRALSRVRDLPPPLAGDGSTVWFTEPGGPVQRRSWPAAHA